MPRQFFTATNNVWLCFPPVSVIQSVKVVISLLLEPQKKILRAASLEAL